jgi:hypothetical protein
MRVHIYIYIFIVSNYYYTPLLSTHLFLPSPSPRPRGNKIPVPYQGDLKSQKEHAKAKLPDDAGTVDQEEGARNSQMGFSVVEAYVGSLRVGFSFGRDFLLRKHLSVRNILRPTQLLTHFKYRQCSAPYLSTSSPPPHLTLTSVPFHSTSPPLQLLHLPSQLLHLSMSQSKGGDHPLGWNVDKPIIHNTLHTDC